MSKRLKLGQAASLAEREAEAAIAAIPLFQGRDVTYSMVTGGISNSNWRIDVDTHSRAYFLKIPGKGSELFINRKAANQAARLAHQRGVGAEVVHFDPASGLELTEFMEGYRASTNVDFLNPQVWSRVTDLYREFHACPPLMITRTIFEMIEEHIVQAHEFKATLPQDFALLRENDDRDVFLRHAAVAEAGVTGRPDDLRGEVIAAFVVLKHGRQPTEGLRRELLATVREELGALAVVGELTFVPMLPKTRSGKIMRRVLKAVVLDRDPGDITTIEDEGSVDEARAAVAELKAELTAGG